MAEGKITIELESRPCFVDGKKALFYNWIKKYDFAWRSEFYMGLIEDENGEVKEVKSEKIKFCDRKIEEYYFPKERKSYFIKIFFKNRSK